MQSTIESVRILLRRMLKDEDVVRGGPLNDGYILASEESAPDGAGPSDDQTLALSYGATAPGTDGSG
jgi:hypothetical protein